MSVRSTRSNLLVITGIASTGKHRPGNDMVHAITGTITKPGNLVSNGAYTLAEFVPNDHIKLVKNANFFDAGNFPHRRKIDRNGAHPLFERRQSVYDGY